MSRLGLADLFVLSFILRVSTASQLTACTIAAPPVGFFNTDSDSNTNTCLCRPICRTPHVATSRLPVLNALLNGNCGQHMRGIVPCSACHTSCWVMYVHPDCWILLQRMLSTRQAQEVPLDSLGGISETRQAFERLPPGERAEKAHLTLVCSIDGDVNHLHRFDSQKRRWQRKKRKLLLLLRWW